MADDRMYLIHRPSRVGVSLGKRYGSGWDNHPTSGSIQKLYDHVKYEFGDPNDFIISCESQHDGWTYCESIDNDRVLLKFHDKTDTLSITGCSCESAQLEVGAGLTLDQRYELAAECLGIDVEHIYKAFPKSVPKFTHPFEGY